MAVPPDHPVPRPPASWRTGEPLPPVISPADQLAAWRRLQPVIQQMLHSDPARRTRIDPDRPPAEWTSSAERWRDVARGMQGYLLALDRGRFVPYQAGPLADGTRIIGLTGIPDNLVDVNGVLERDRFQRGPLAGQAESVNALRAIARMGGMSDLYFMSRVLGETSGDSERFTYLNNVAGLMGEDRQRRSYQMFGNRFEGALAAVFRHYRQDLPYFYRSGPQGPNVTYLGVCHQWTPPPRNGVRVGNDIGGHNARAAGTILTISQEIAAPLTTSGVPSTTRRLLRLPTLVRESP
jgi:hypothetical protein